MATADSTHNITIVPGTSLPSQPWWPKLHEVIIEAYIRKDFSVFPPTWTRLDADPVKGAQGLAEELGEDGHFAVAFTADDRPVACSGVLPFRGENWINTVLSKSDADLAKCTITDQTERIFTDWEICCFCVHPSARGSGLSCLLLDTLVEIIRPRGAKKLFANYVVEETGKFWPRKGFELIPGAGGKWLKGTQIDPDKEGLRADIHFSLGVRTV